MRDLRSLTIYNTGIAVWCLDLAHASAPREPVDDFCQWNGNVYFDKMRGMSTPVMEPLFLQREREFARSYYFSTYFYRYPGDEFFYSRLDYKVKDIPRNTLAR